MKERELSKSSIEDRRHVGRRFLASLAIGMCVTSLSSDHLSYAAALGVPDDLFIVALGDSYPSGEGNPPFEETTNIDGVNQCHRSELAYPAIVARDIHAEFRNVACSGATVEAVLHGGWNETPQVLALRNKTDVVILQINGNVIDNRGIFAECQEKDCDEGSLTYTEVREAIRDPQNQQDTEQLLETVLEKAPIANVFVVEYPNPVNSIGISLARSTGVASRSTRAMISMADMASSEINELNKRAIAAVGSDRVHYIPTSIGGPQTVYLSGNEALHPNSEGHRQLAKDVEQELSRLYRAPSQDALH